MGGGDYFDELLARIRDIRSSERVFWRKVLDIYASSVDYDPSAAASRHFFQTVQNKMHWAVAASTMSTPSIRCPSCPRLRGGRWNPQPGTR